MTINEYVENPMGKGDAALGTNRTMLKGILTEKYERLVSKKKIKSHCYATRNGKGFIIHMIIPSESERDNSYDVVFEFIDTKKELGGAGSLRDYDVRVFANSPSFAYTFAYVYKKHGLLIEPLTSKLGKKFVKIAPDVRNRYQIVSYEKYIFFGAKYIMESGLLAKSTLEKHLEKLTRSDYPGEIRTLDQIMKEYEVAEGKIRKRKKKEAVAQKKLDNEKKRELQQIKSGVHNVGTIKKTMGHTSSNIKQKKATRHITTKKGK